MMKLSTTSLSAGIIGCCAPLLAATLQGKPATETRPNILLILSDDHSSLFLGCYGFPGLKTPNIDRFAQMDDPLPRCRTTANPTSIK